MAEMAIRQSFLDLEHPAMPQALLRHIVRYADCEGARERGTRPGAETLLGANHLQDSGMHHRLEFCPVLVMVGERRQRHHRLTWLGVADDQQGGGRYASRQTSLRRTGAG